MRWRSQVIAAIGLLGAALAPALQSLDTTMSWESAAFALIVLVAAGAVAVPRDWHQLVLAASAVVVLQVEWLVVESSVPGEPGVVTVASFLCLTLLGIAIGRQLRASSGALDPMALAYASGASAIALVLTLQLFAADHDRGLALVSGAAVWSLVFFALQLRHVPDLALVVGMYALALAAVGTAFLLVGTTLTVVWAAQSVALAAIAWRLGDARLRAMGIAYAGLAAVHTLGTDASLGRLFEETSDQGAGVLPLASAAVAAGASAIMVPERYVLRTEHGLLAFVRDLRLGLERRAAGILETLSFGAAALATLAVSFALVAVSFEDGHVAATFLAAGIGALTLSVASLRGSTGLAVASYVWLAVVLVEAFADADRFYDDATAFSSGGWSLVGASTGLLAGAHLHRTLDPDRRGADWLLGIASAVVAVAATAGVSLVTETLAEFGVGIVLVSAAYVALAAGAFVSEDLRNASTILWAFGLVFLVAAEAALVTDDDWRTVVIVLTGLVVGSLARQLAEMRLWLAGGSLALVTSALALLAQVQPWLAEGELERRSALVSAACAVSLLGLALLVWGQERWRSLSAFLWSGGILAVLATERVIIGDLRWTAVVVAFTGALLVILAGPLAEDWLWFAGAATVGATVFASFVAWTPADHLFVASDSPADGLWVLAGCTVAFAVVALTAPDREIRTVLAAAAGVAALYAVSLGILGIAVRVSGASVETDFERGHTAVSAVWALLGLTLLVVGLLRGSAAIRYGGLTLFGFALAKIFLYDLAELSSVARAFSFILVGALLLAGGFILQRLSDRLGPPRPPTAPPAGI